jgi:RNA polymerase sigma-70 factor, ECF subfamily
MNEVALDFEKVYDDFRPRILRYLTRLVGAGEAEDLTQEVFVRISRALGSFRGEAQLSTWVYRIATNAALDRLRSPSFKRLAPSELAEDGGSDRLEAEVQAVGAEAGTRPPEEQLFRLERYECYRDVLEGLPDNYRTVVTLSDLGDLAVDEIAEILGLTPAAVKVRLCRGRARLLKELRDHCQAEDWL